MSRHAYSLPQNNTPGGDGADGDEEEDYLTMTFAETPSGPETSLQRRVRIEREACARARVKSKAELAAEAEARHEATNAISLLARGPGKSKGLAIMARMGFRPGSALGRGDNADARAEPLRVHVRDGREGIGLESERKRKMRDAAESVKKARVDETTYRERIAREREERRVEGLVVAAQKVAEKMEDKEDKQDKQEKEEDEEDEEEEEEALGQTVKEKKKIISTRPLKSIPVEWRGLVRQRELADRDRRMRRDLEAGLSASRLPDYDDADEDEDDKTALGKDATVYEPAEDANDEDAELDEFEAREPTDKLRRLVTYLRDRHWYCFWCKYAYPDATMDGCPGSTEEDHD